MRLLIDLFPCQTDSRLRGIGRYGMALTRALIDEKAGHDVYAVADQQYASEADELRTLLLPTLGAGRFACYTHAGAPFGRCAPVEERLAGDLVTGAYRVLAPDATLCLSPFEDWGQDGVVPDPRVRVGDSVRAAVIHDLIPWLFPEQYLDTSQPFKAWYSQRVRVLREYDVLLANSEATRRDAIEHLGIDGNRIVTIGAAVDERFQAAVIPPPASNLEALGITRPYILYTGNGDYRKNLRGFVQAYARLPAALRASHQMVVNQVGDSHRFWAHARELGLCERDIVVTGHIRDEVLVSLYQRCKLFVFPSLYEGFGLPVLEAMACGAPIIAANNSSIPEVVGRTDVLFDAADTDSITASMVRVLTDEALLRELSAYGQKRAKEFNWSLSAQKTWKALEQARSRRDAEGARRVSRPIPVRLVTGEANGVERLPSALAASAAQDIVASSPPADDAIVIYAPTTFPPPSDMLEWMASKPGVLFVDEWADTAPVPESGARGMLTGNGRMSGEPQVRDVLDSVLHVVARSAASVAKLRDRYAGRWFPPVTALDAATDAQGTVERVIDSVYYRSPECLVSEVAASLGTTIGADAPLIDRVCASVGQNLRLNRRNRLLIDVSQLARHDPKSGIQRVVRNIVREICRGSDTPPVEVVRIREGRLVRTGHVVDSLLQVEPGSYGEAEIELHPGDTLLMLDSSWEMYDEFDYVFTQVRKFGGRIVTVVYDLIPIRHPEYCVHNLVVVFNRWLLAAIQQSDALFCISDSVRKEVAQYIEERGLVPPRPLRLDSWNLGADLMESGTGTLRAEVAALNGTDEAGPLFLMVGTIEPRKGHEFVLGAFDRIWAQGGTARLCLAGKEGWHVEALMARIRQHPMLGTRLFLVENFTDNEINHCYANAVALIAASTMEGYGLPIVEAALHGVPAVASDIPVFREVGGQGALYFRLGDAASLESAVNAAAAMSRPERQAMAARIQPITWRESARQLTFKLFGPQPQAAR